MSESSRPIRIPGPDHPITIAANPATVVVRAGDIEIARTRDALTLREANYPAVQYIPRSDVRMDLLSASAHASYCPYKGEAGYFDMPMLGASGINAVWTYPAPFDAVAAIAGHVAFYPDRVSITEPDAQQDAGN
ncbi:MAG: hypothetical protein DI547_01810 [Sphingobium sp.]|nr:MAG: hypothetical protein DI547_01810 [Sphingobium sp.]